MSGLLLVKNKKALFEHQLQTKYTAGIVLLGHEVKAIREKNASFDGAYVQLIQGEPFVVNMHVGEYSKQSQKPSELPGASKKSRKLLLNKNEIAEITRELKIKGNTAIPLALVLHNNLVKLEFALVKGKKEFEKKQTVKERQIERDLQNNWKDFHRSMAT
jgi:SsrA-binding protein